jgi:hypothetical protein
MQLNLAQEAIGDHPRLRDVDDRRGAPEALSSPDPCLLMPSARGLADRGYYRLLDLTLIELVGEKPFDNRDLFALLLRQVCAFALSIECYRFATPLDYHL